MTSHRLEFGWVLPDGTYLCDGCNVREPHEHRCHHGDGAWKDNRSCQCQECNPDQINSQKLPDLQVQENNIESGSINAPFLISLVIPAILTVWSIAYYHLITSGHDTAATWMLIGSFIGGFGLLLVAAAVLASDDEPSSPTQLSK